MVLRTKKVPMLIPIKSISGYITFIRGERFSIPLLSASSLFRIQFQFKSIISSNRECKDFCLEPDIVSKGSFLSCLNFANDMQSSWSKNQILHTSCQYYQYWHSPSFHAIQKKLWPDPNFQ
jgi:hypothetical protein